jgi:hypothetical protein
VKNPYNHVLYRTTTFGTYFEEVLELVLTVLGRSAPTTKARFSRLSLDTVFEKERLLGE